MSMLRYSICLLSSCLAFVTPSALAVDADATGWTRVEADYFALEGQLTTPKLPFDDRRYTLAYEVFLANNNLHDAFAVALSAVRQAPNSAAWRRRLAQVADWVGEASLGIEQWHAYARLTGDAEAWNIVLARAPQVFDHDRWIEALQYRLGRVAPDSSEVPQLIGKLVYAHEQRGTPEAAIVTLRKHKHGPHRKAVLDLLAGLAERVGDEDLLEETLVELLGLEPGNVGYALRFATLEARRGDKSAAFAALAMVSAEADVANDVFWDAYIALARQTGHVRDAIKASRRLVASGHAKEHHYTLLSELLEPEAPRLAAEAAAQGYRRFGNPYLARRALYLFHRSGDASAARAFHASLTLAQQNALAQDAFYVHQRALIELSAGQPRRALALARDALKLEADNAELRSLVVWSLIALKDDKALRATLREWARLAANEDALWDPFAAGWLMLQEPREALHYLRKKLRDSNDPLWWLNFADALEQTGASDMAWRVRRHAWLELRKQPATNDERQEEIDGRMVALALLFEPSDAARARLLALLRKHRAELARHDIARVSALAYTINRGTVEVAHAWLLAGYAKALERPAWAQLSVALANGDQAKLHDLLDTVADWLPQLDRVEATQRTGRLAEAQTLAYERLEKLREYDEMHTRLTNLTAIDLSPEPSGEPSNEAAYMGFGFETQRIKPLTEHQQGFTGTLHASQHLKLSLTLAILTRKSSDTAQLIKNPKGENRLTLTARHAIAGNGELSAQLISRDGYGNGTGVVLQASRDVTPRLRLTMRLGLKDLATDNAYLRIGGGRDVLAATLLGRLSHRDYLVASLEANRYAALDGGMIGSGHITRFEAGHYLRIEYPDFKLRATWSDAAYNARAGLEPTLALLSPQPITSNTSLLPDSFSQFGLGMAIGESVRSSYTRAWRPWFSLGLFNDRLNGTSVQLEGGGVGSFLGNDRLEFSARCSSAGVSNIQPSLSFGLHYQWMY